MMDRQDSDFDDDEGRKLHPFNPTKKKLDCDRQDSDVSPDTGPNAQESDGSKKPVKNQQSDSSQSKEDVKVMKKTTGYSPTDDMPHQDLQKDDSHNRQELDQWKRKLEHSKDATTAEAPTGRKKDFSNTEEELENTRAIEHDEPEPDEPMDVQRDIPADAFPGLSTPWTPRGPQDGVVRQLSLSAGNFESPFNGHLNIARQNSQAISSFMLDTSCNPFDLNEPPKVKKVADGSGGKGEAKTGGQPNQSNGGNGKTWARAGDGRNSAKQSNGDDDEDGDERRRPRHTNTTKKTCGRQARKRKRPKEESREGSRSPSPKRVKYMDRVSESVQELQQQMQRMSLGRDAHITAHLSEKPSPAGQQMPRDDDIQAHRDVPVSMPSGGASAEVSPRSVEAQSEAVSLDGVGTSTSGFVSDLSGHTVDYQDSTSPMDNVPSTSTATSAGHNAVPPSSTHTDGSGEHQGDDAMEM